jgi:hypothetical protein
LSGFSQIDFSCDFGEQCNATLESGEGQIYLDWYGFDDETGQVSLVAHYLATCYDPAGCWSQTWWTPPNFHWAGDNVQAYSDATVEFIGCWCGDGSNNCEIF